MTLDHDDDDNVDDDLEKQDEDGDDDEKEEQNEDDQYVHLYVDTYLGGTTSRSEVQLKNNLRYNPKEGAGRPDASRPKTHMQVQTLIISLINKKILGLSWHQF